MEDSARRTVLVLGGTAWVGHEIARRMLAHGDDVTCLARGDAGAVPAGANLVRADRAVPGAYAAVADTAWDEVIEISYRPEFVAGALEALAARARHWTLVSTVSVYASSSEPGADESAAVVERAEPVDPDDYAQAKLAAERATASAVGDRLLIARPGLIGGPGDVSDRTGYWVGRFALAGDGEVLAPATAGRWVQVVDVRDLAEWIALASVRQVTGVINVAGDPYPLADVLDLAAEVAGFTGGIVPADDDWLAEHDVQHWSGPRSLPLWLPATASGFARRSNAAFLAAGGRLLPLRETLARTLEDERARGLDRVRRSGLSRVDELELLALRRGAAGMSSA
ncbi:NAD-dependent epimerase/dehydratase family protein [Lacisediminihabitans sp.]|uniref:NAD-dependent epimerase/dehydratase family protein n=1 Tax=Lacisediminihabitans sp. TaxID=2787631 RepID=UPI00374DD4B0